MMGLRCTRGLWEAACHEPVTLAAAAAVASAGVSAFGAIRQGQAAQASANYNAQLAEQEGRQAREAANLQAQRITEQGRRLTATQRARMAAGGVQIDEGTPLLVLADQARELELERANTYAAGERRNRAGLNEANLQRLQGRSALQAGYLQAGASVLGGGARAYSILQRD